jgi:hypothetical protein
MTKFSKLIIIFFLDRCSREPIRFLVGWMGFHGAKTLSITTLSIKTLSKMAFRNTISKM